MVRVSNSRLRRGATLIAALGIVAWAFQGPQPAAAQTSNTITITSPRPVAKAVEELVEKYGYVITYEDPEYVYPGDLQDATQYRRDLNQFPAGRAPKIWVPLGGNVQLQLPSDTKPTAQDILNSLHQLVQSQNVANEGGHFAVEQDSSGAFHVVPTEVRDPNGNWQPVTSILATAISLPTQARTEHDTFKAICNAISAQVLVKVDPIVNSGVEVGLVQFGSTHQTYTLGAQNEAASRVLTRAFQMIGVKRTWLLYFDPTDHTYALNIISLPPSPSS